MELVIGDGLPWYELGTFHWCTVGMLNDLKEMGFYFEIMHSVWSPDGPLTLVAINDPDDEYQVVPVD